MNKKQSALIVFGIFIASLLVVLPNFLSAFVDPNDLMVHGTALVDGVSKASVDMKYDDIGNIYSLLHIPVFFRLPWYSFYLFAILLGCVTCVYSVRFDGEMMDLFGWMIKKTLIIQSILVLVSIFLVLYNSNTFLFLEDNNLSDLERYAYGDWVVTCMVGIPIVFFILSDIVVLLISLLYFSCDEYVSTSWNHFKERMLEAIDLDRSVLIINRKNDVVATNFEYRMKWWPFPMLVLVKLESYSDSLNDVIEKVVEPQKDTMLKRIRACLIYNINNRFMRLLGTRLPILSDKIAERIAVTYVNNTKSAIDSLKNDSDPAFEKARDILQKVSNAGLERMKADIKENAEAFFSEFQASKYELLLTEFIEATREDDRSHAALDIHPAGVKICRTSGEKTVVVVEEEPRVRSIQFSKRFLEYDDYPDAVSGRLPLAFPYVVFVMTFLRNSFSELHVYYRNSPLTSLSDMLYQPNLPNIYEGHYTVCMGDYESKKTTISEQIQEVLASFWGSEFNTDLRDLYYNAGLKDSRLKTVYSWKMASQEDPLFSTSVNWNVCSQNLKNIINSQLDGHWTSTRDIVGKILGGTEERFGADFMEWMEKKEIKDRQYEKALISEFTSSLLNIYSEIAKENDETSLAKKAKSDEHETLKNIDREEKDMLATLFGEVFDSISSHEKIEMQESFYSLLNMLC